jgi:hypothetical protein
MKVKIKFPHPSALYPINAYTSWLLQQHAHSDTHAQSIMVNDVIIPTRNLQHPPWLSYRVQEVTNFEYGVVS